MLSHETSANDAAAIQATRRALLLVAAAPLAAQLIGSIFNIWYNLLHIKPLLTEGQRALFVQIIQRYNVTAYPCALIAWCWVVFSLRRAYLGVLTGEGATQSQLVQARRRAVNLPWWSAGLSGLAWGLTIPVFLAAMTRSPEPLDANLYMHLPVSLLIGGVIAVTQGAFAAEMAAHRLLMPVLFAGAEVWRIPGARPLTLRGRGVMYAGAGGVCPIVIMLLLILAPGETGWGFAFAAAGLGVAFALSTALLFGRIVTAPLMALRRAAQQIAAGDLNAEVKLVRVDEFGLLIHEFNGMVAELREKQRLQETFGRHVGQRTAQLLMQRDPQLGGVLQPVTVLFVDIRDFTTRCSHCTPQTVVSVLNEFFGDMVEVVEQQCGGMVNKFVGDGFMALFGAEDPGVNHGAMALKAGQQMLHRLDATNARLQSRGYGELAIGIGIHSGPAVVGSIGSPRRRDFTAIGDTVNVASRVESLTKTLEVPLLITEATRAMLPAELSVRAFAPQPIKGKEQPICVFAVPSPAKATEEDQR